MPSTSAVTRERILDTAEELFYARGIRAVGIDAVAAAGGVAPTTLYRLFGSKDGLVAEYLTRLRERQLAWFERLRARAGDDPAEQLAALFDGIDRQVSRPGYRGCAFLMAVTEFPDPDVRAHRVAVSHKRWLRDLFRDLALAAGLQAPERLADQLLVLMNGVYASAQELGGEGPAGAGKALARSLIEGSRTASTRGV